MTSKFQMTKGTGLAVSGEDNKSFGQIPFPGQLGCELCHDAPAAHTDRARSLLTSSEVPDSEEDST